MKGMGTRILLLRQMPLPVPCRLKAPLLRTESAAYKLLDKPSGGKRQFFPSRPFPQGPQTAT
jgi:hypothetical protein